MNAQSKIKHKQEKVFIKYNKTLDKPKAKKSI